MGFPLIQVVAFISLGLLTLGGRWAFGRARAFGLDGRRRAQEL